MTNTAPARRPDVSKSNLALSPSRVHRRLMAEMTPALAYDGGDVRRWQQRLRRKLRQRLGYDKMPREKMPREKTPLHIRSLWKQEHELGTIEKLVFTSEPGADVPAYLCLPGGHKPPHPVFICLQGHSTGMHNSIAVAIDDEDKPIEVQGDRDFGLGCLRRGVAALCIEQRSFGERKEREQEKVNTHGCHDAAMHAMMLGRTLAAERVYDVDRGIDLLAGRDDIDMSRLGVMGNSGGGTITIYAAALLPRVKFAMPSCAFCTYRDSIMSISHCGDNYVPGLLQDAESADVLGLFAPKPVVVVNGKLDEIFPLAPARRAFADLKAIYHAAGAEDNCRLVVGDEGHRFYAEQAWKAMLPYLKK